MTKDEIRETLARALLEIAPELEAEDLEAQLDLRHDLELDSMDFLNFVIALSRAFPIEVPEADYGQLRTIEACVRYVSTKLGD